MAVDGEYIRLREFSGNTPSSKSLTDNFKTSQFSMFDRPRKAPVKSIALAVFLFIIGTVLLIIGSLLVAGVVIPDEYADRTIPVLILGAIAFLPGSYHTYIAWAAYKNYHGYSYDAIPSFDD